LRRKSTGGGRRLEGEEEEGSCRGELRGERTVEMLVGRGREREKKKKVDGITYSEFSTPP
jgi:hypothetical protein